ncbi:MAG: hypothetical protein NC132_06460 [Corallococcus sp.]|nr:hypothetical protein [Corallococcus sp.]MCM1395726.1 hypothetical protein [Corallococcus sp.]
MKNTEKRKNEFKLRIYDEDTLINLDEIQKIGRFDSMNELLNKVIEKGSSVMLAGYGKRGILSEDTEELPDASHTEIRNKLTSIASTLDDIFVITSIIETLGAVLFNIENAKINDEPITTELLQSGAYSDLPDWLQEIKDMIIRSKHRR